MFNYPHQLVRLRRKPIPHPYGGDGGYIPDWGSDDLQIETTPLEGCCLAPKAMSTFNADGRDIVTNTAEVYGPVGLDLRPGDRVQTADGRQYDVQGESGNYVSPFSTWQAGAVISVTAVEG